MPRRPPQRLGRELTDTSGEIADLVKGSTHLVKYNLIEQWIKLGWAEVL